VDEPLIINTGPLIALARMGCLDEIGRLPYRFVCPREVRLELDSGAAVGHPPIVPPWLAVKPLSAPPTPVGVIELGPGETAVIQLALELEARVVAIDEVRGRRMAAVLGLQVTGSLGLAARARRVGLLPELRPFLDRAARQGVWYHEAIVAEILRDLGEE
jgi:predicted nucleic acid-binding protein